VTFGALVAGRRPDHDAAMPPVARRVVAQAIAGAIAPIARSALAADAVRLDIDHQCFLAQHDLVWDELPMRWENAPFNGNGLVGSMLYAAPDGSGLRLALGRGDIGKLDFPGQGKNGNRIPLGALALTRVSPFRDPARRELHRADAAKFTT
jgi:hypothetical protein